MLATKTLKNILLITFLLWGPQALAEGVLAIKANSDTETITLSVEPTSPNKIFFLQNPDRLVVDVPVMSHGISLPSDYSGDLIKGVRSGRFDGGTTRIVFDLARPATLLAKEIGSDAIKIGIAGKSKGSKKVDSIAPAKPKRDEKPLIVIDPGHGGEDPGTRGKRGSLEKDVVLIYAKALKDALLKTGKYRVQLTRDDDHFIILRERFKIARKAGAAIFISLHADSAPDGTARGLSVYTVSEKASDAEAEALAAAENKVDVLADVDLSKEDQGVADILISLAQRDTKNQSALLADKLVIALGDRISLLENTHRFAGFAVLKAPDVPSVLIETGFLSNRRDELALNSRDYRGKVVQGIVEGVNSYFASRGSENVQ
jgi:N-acetylmuramoyl-L-alanine amidase